MESVQQDTNMKCGLLECPAFGKCEIWARTEGTIETLSTIATRRGTGRLCQLRWGAQCMCTIVAALMEICSDKKMSQSGYEFECSCGR